MGKTEDGARAFRVPLHWLFILAGATSGIAFGILSVGLPVYALKLGASAAETGFLRAATGLGMLIAVLPAGMAVDRFGVRRVFFLASAANAASVALCALAASPETLAFAMMGEAFTRAFVFAALASAFLHALPLIGLHRAGWNKAAISLGISFFGPFLGGALMWGLPFGGVFAIAAVMMCSANLPLRFIPVPEAAQREEHRRSIASRFAERRASLASLFRSPGVPTCLAAETLLTAVFASFATFIVVLAVTERGLAAMEAAWIAGVEGAAYIATSFFAGTWIQRFAFPVALGVGTAVIVPSLAGLAFAEGFLLLFVFATTLGLGIGLLTLVVTMRAGTLPGAKGEISSLFMTATGLGGMVGPAFAGAIAAAFGTPAVFLSFMPLFVALLAVTAIRARAPRISSLIPSEEK
ncbi:major facilitator superfamily MFS_1 [Rhodomicrobium vannielii ATCC 17100]|uniref:Major facilitator superfamily MFS_1 n=1 Tax=Rhodomicrobium vannielii (strain ATCC 17100 / DSM 162 / LMG 4299 / NCIMB 10020 / ATH 3.1.1) TaxID=648757 RepID=E3I4R1_RHOVT|nr:MFS transporter [Rhodomicrobium vannielii]ADP72733.1 major facilitator superfamily MFS_1 [Rhodomicrobium vannielii ATCC 17100]